MQRGPRRSAAPGAVSDPIVRSPAGTVAPGSQLPIIDGKYQLVRQLGEGGMGAVYEARNRGTGRRVAIKVIAGEALARSGEIVAPLPARGDGERRDRVAVHRARHRHGRRSAAPAARTW